MRKINSEFKTKFISEAGSFLKNKDFFAFVELDFFACYVIADGIDNDKELESAKIAVETIIRNFIEKPSIKKRNLKKLMRIANKELIKQSKDMNLKCSLTALITDYTNIIYSYCGNTRLYLFRKGALKEKTEDHSLSQNLVENNKMSMDKVAKHEERNNLYSYMGMKGTFKPYISNKIKLQDGDIITLLTRGIWENVDQGEFLDILNDASENSEVLDNTEEVILSKQPKELENYTLAAIFVDKIYEDPGNRKKKIKKIIKILIPILIIVLVITIILLVKHYKDKEKLENMNGHLNDAIEYVDKNNYIRAQEEFEEALKLSKKLKLEDKTVEIDDKFKVAEQIVNADKTFMDKNYVDAHEAFKEALHMTYDADRIGEKYIEERLKVINTYININDLLALGDTMVEGEDLQEAEKVFKEAKEKSGEIYFSEGRKEALNRLKDIHEKMAEEKKNEKEAAVEAEEKDKEKKAKKEEAEEKKNDAMIKSIEQEKKGDLSYETLNYDDAKMYYSIAKELYFEAGLFDRVQAVEEKLLLVEKKIINNEKEGSKGELYEEEAEKRFKENDLFNSKMLYVLARDKYEEIGDTDKVIKVNEKLDIINTLIDKQSKDSKTEESK